VPCEARTFLPGPYGPRRWPVRLPNIAIRPDCRPVKESCSRSSILGDEDQNHSFSSKRAAAAGPRGTKDDSSVAPTRVRSRAAERPARCAARIVSSEKKRNIHNGNVRFAGPTDESPSSAPGPCSKKGKVFGRRGGGGGTFYSYAESRKVFFSYSPPRSVFPPQKVPPPIPLLPLANLSIRRRRSRRRPEFWPGSARPRRSGNAPASRSGAGNWGS